jgi:hypothetical protein
MTLHTYVKPTLKLNQFSTHSIAPVKGRILSGLVLEHAHLKWVNVTWLATFCGCLVKCKSNSGIGDYTLRKPLVGAAPIWFRNVLDRSSRLHGQSRRHVAGLPQTAASSWQPVGVGDSRDPGVLA